MERLSYEPYNKTKLAVRGPEKYDALIKTIGGRWNSRMKGGPGWMLDNNKESQIKTLIFNINSTLPPEDNQDEDDEDDKITSGEIQDQDEDDEDDGKMRSSFDQQNEDDDDEYRPSSRSNRRDPEPNTYNERNQYDHRDHRDRREHRNRREHDMYMGSHHEPREYRREHREFEDALVNKYRMKDDVDTYYSRFSEKTRLKKNNNRQMRQELSESESESEYDSDELESLTHTLSKLHRKVESLKNKSRGRKHKKRDRH